MNTAVQPVALVTSVMVRDVPSTRTTRVSLKIRAFFLGLITQTFKKK